MDGWVKEAGWSGWLVWLAGLGWVWSAGKGNGRTGWTRLIDTRVTFGIWDLD